MDISVVDPCLGAFDYHSSSILSNASALPTSPQISVVEIKL